MRRHTCIVFSALLLGAFACGLGNRIPETELEAISENAGSDLIQVAAPQMPEFVQNGWEAGKKLLQSIKDNDFVKTVKTASKWFMPLAQSIGYFAKVFTGFIESDSKELKFIKEQFLQVNLKMDSMEQEFHEIKKMLDWNAIKVSFGEYERSITSLQEMLVGMTDAEKDVADVMRDQFIMLYERTSIDAPSKLYEGIMNTQSIYTENLVAAVRKYTGDHRRKVQKFLLGILQLIVKGLEVEMMFMTFKGYNSAIEYWQKEWETRMDKMCEVFKKADDEILGGYEKQIDIDMEEFNAKNHALNHQEYAQKLYNYLVDKFLHRDFLVMVYNPVVGTDQHHMISCNGHPQFRVRNHNIFVVSTDSERQQTFDEATARRLLDTVINFSNDYLPNWLVSQMQKSMPVDCQKYSMAAAIRLNADLAYVSKESRTAYRQFNHRYFDKVKTNMLVFG